MKKHALALAAAAALSGCSAPPLDELAVSLKTLAMAIFGSNGQVALRRALQEYENGDHAAAQASFRQALDHGLQRADQVVARKHLAFIHCAAERVHECRTQFVLALRVDPKADLDPAEAGHPAWGPVFRSLPR